MGKLIKRSGLLIIGIFSLSFTGCLRTYYPLNYKQISTPIIFETDNTNDHNSFSKYVGAEYTTASGGYENETINILRAFYSTAYTKNNTNFNLEAFAFGGNYKVVGLSNEYDGNKTAFGIGGNFKFAANLKIDNLKLGLGANLGASAEFGEYIDFINKAKNSGIIDVTSKRFLFSFSLFPFIAYQFDKSTILSLQINSGIPEFISPIILLSSKNISTWVSFLPNNEKSIERLALGIKFEL